jgi:enamine deaminase RidA (YjgF/YER057c/UK114 family)
VHHREGPIPRDGGPGISLLVTGTGESHRPVVGELVSDSIERQTEQTIDNTAAILEADGAFLSDVVKVNTHLSDLGLFARYNTVYARRFLRPFPARTTVGSDLSHSPGAGRSRRPGGGRKPLTFHDPDLLQALEGLVKPSTRGDPESPLRWSAKSTRHLAEELNRQGYRIAERKVADLLHQLGYSLQANAKTIEGRQHPDRNAQFEYVNEQTKKFLAQNLPVISVDTKKKECVSS